MRKLIFALIIFCIATTSCKPDVKLDAKLDLAGKWNFVKAYRNQKETKTLDSGFFVFNTKDTLVHSNLFQTGDTKKYEISQNTILVKDEELNLNIDRIEQDTMVLKGKIWKFDMELYLQRENQDSLGM